MVLSKQHKGWQWKPALEGKPKEEYILKTPQVPQRRQRGEPNSTRKEPSSTQRKELFKKYKIKK